MKIMNRRRVLSFLLALAMTISLIPGNVFPIFAAEGEQTTTETPVVNEETLANNVGKQVVFDFWTEFLFVNDPTHANIVDIYNTDPETKYNDVNYWYYYFQSETYPDSPYINAWEVLMQIEAYQYDSTNGYHWYQVSCSNPSAELKPVLDEKSWILYTTDKDLESNTDPYLVIYDKDETVRFVTSATVEETRDELTGEVIKTTTNYNYYVVSGPASIKDVTIDISRIYSNYPESPLAYTELTYSTTFSKGYSISLYTEDEEENKTPWAADGTLSVRYEASQFGGASYTEDVYYGAAYMYVNGTVVSSDLNDLYNWDSIVASEVLTTSSASSTLVFEHLCPNSELLGNTGYFTEETVQVYDNTLASYKEFSVADYSNGFTVECIVYQRVLNTEDPENPVIADEIPWYWISVDGHYCFVSIDCVTFMDPCVPKLNGMINLKVRFLAELQDEYSTVDYLYETPGFAYTALENVYVYDLPAVMKIVDTYYTSEDDVYFKLEGANGNLWPGEYGNHPWVSANMLELVTINYSEMAPFGPPVVGQSMAVFARTAVRLAEVEAIAETLESDGVVTQKVVTPTGTPGEYTVTLEAYVTGEKTTITITEDIATDIVLVLDQSGSMDYDFEAISGYNVASGTASRFEDTDLYVKVGEEYVKVTVTTITETGYTYTRYTRNNNNSQNRRNYEIYNNQSNLYYEINGEYWPIEVDRSGSNGSGYTYTYYYVPASGSRVQIGQPQEDEDNRPDFNTFRFYTRTTSNNVPSEYTYSYVDANGVTQSETFGANDNITTNKYYTAQTTTTTRLQALKDAVTVFANSVHEKAKGKDGQLGTDDDVNHRIAVVGFGRADYGQTPYYNTKVFIGGSTYQYGTAAQGQYANAFQDMNTTAGYSNVMASKNALDAEGGTYVDLGLEMANGIFAANPVEAGTKRNRVVIVFTDGDPGYNGNWNGSSYGNSGDAEAVADKAIINATTSKSTYGATVYAVGIFEGADAETRPVTSVSPGNQFMHYVSSNYTGGTSFDSPGTASFPVKGSYYLSASNTNDLTGIFQQISQNVEGGGASMTLDETTVVRDIVSPNFVVPSGTTGIKYYTSQYTGPDTWANRVEATGVSANRQESNGTTTLDVSGFDFSENYVGTETLDGNVTGYRGKKLIIEFTINEDPDFLGGSNVDTNGALSGIYTGDGNPVEYFTQPKVDVTLKKISTVVQNKYIYYGNTVNLTDILNLYVKRNDQDTPLQVTVDGINNAYVTLEYTIKLDDNTIAVYTIPAGAAWANGTWSVNEGNLLRNYAAKGETSFSVSCVMTDVGDSTLKSTASGTAYVFVYKPTLTFKDSVQEYNKPLAPTAADVNSFLNGHYVGVQWTLEASANRPTDYADYAIDGTEPTFTFTFNDVGNAFDGMVMKSVKDVPINVTVTTHGVEAFGGNATSITGNTYITFAHQDCDPDCGFDPSTEQFIVHVINALTSLTITKADYAEFVKVDANQTFLFNITGTDADGKPIDLTVTVNGDGSVTIYGLVIGNEYTITELTDWSWRYQCTGWTYNGASGSNEVATITIVENQTITFTNSRPVDKWLDGDAWCDNLFSLVTTVKDEEE